MDELTIQEEAFKRGYEKGRSDAMEVVHGQRLYNAHEVAEILADSFGDTCACNFNGNDEWLPFKCELQSACPNPAGVACWEQYLKYREAKMDGVNRVIKKKKRW